MEKLSIEEKAKRYDEAIEKAKNWYVDSQIDFKESLEDLFPELKESEDERIRKTLIGWVNIEPKESFENGFSKEEILTWLEKQGEKKKFSINNIVQTTEVQQRPAKWSEEDDKMFEYALDMIEWYSGKSESKSRAVSDWLKFIKNRVLPQSKQEWSEEDEKMLNDICIDIMEYIPKSFEENSKKVNWLKSLRPQSHWKPSDEQMKFLWKYAEQNNYDGTILSSLYNDLKKL